MVGRVAGAAGEGLGHGLVDGEGATLLALVVVFTIAEADGVSKAVEEVAEVAGAVEVAVVLVDHCGGLGEGLRVTRVAFGHGMWS